MHARSGDGPGVLRYGRGGFHRRAHVKNFSRSLGAHLPLSSSRHRYCAAGIPAATIGNTFHEFRGATMKAIRVHSFGGPEMLTYEDVPDPRPGADEVVVRAEAIGVNPVETYQRSGSNPSLALPYIPGTDAAGIVQEVGADVTEITPGDRVYVAARGNGAYAELVLCKAWAVYPLPDSLEAAQGAAIGVPYTTAYHALFAKAKILPGETVLIHGATGGVGLAALQLARRAGAITIATGGSGEGRALLHEQGADHVLDHHAPDYLKQIPALTGGRGVDAVIEMLANVNLGRDLTVLAMHGRIVVVGSRGTVDVNPRDAMARDATIHGLMMNNTPVEELKRIHAGLGAGLRDGTLTPVVSERIPLADARRAHEDVMKSGAHGKIVLIPEKKM
jgi:NADPH2:quinone reductase